MGKKRNFITGMAIGASLGVLFAPKSGAETRKELADKVNNLLEKLKEEVGDIDDYRFTLEDKLIEIKNTLDDLDKEKVKLIAQRQVKKIKLKAEEVYELAYEKGSPILQKAAHEVREKAIKLLHHTADSLNKPKIKKES